MQSVYIKFLTEADRARGFFELAKHSRVGSLPGQVYQVPNEALAILDAGQINYRRATDAEVKDANDQVQILLPLFYNDGRPIEPEKFLATDDDLVAAFGASSTDQVTVRGRWKYQSTVYSDQLIRVRVDVEDTPANQDAIRAIEESLKLRFDQLDIWITAYRLDVI